MTIILKKGDSIEKLQEQLQEIAEKEQDRRRKRKREILEATAGTVVFDKEKTPLEIQKEMRDDW